LTVFLAVDVNLELRKPGGSTIHKWIFMEDLHPSRQRAGDDPVMGRNWPATALMVSVIWKTIYSASFQLLLTGWTPCFSWAVYTLFQPGVPVVRFLIGKSFSETRTSKQEGFQQGNGGKWELRVWSWSGPRLEKSPELWDCDKKRKLIPDQI
jgi:hypothetical protein